MMKFLGLLFFLTANISYAGDRVGNGGDIIYCEGGAGELFFVLEEYEGNVVPVIGDPNIDYVKKVETLIGRLKKDFPARYAFYTSLFQYFQRRVTFLDKRLPEISDEGSPQHHTHCEIVQAAYFKRNSQNELVYYLQKNIWQNLTNDQKAILVFHELIYTEAVGLGHSDSRNVRMANRMIFTGKMFQPALFDEEFISPLRNQTPSVSVLSQAYSEGVAIYLLQQDLSSLYSNKSLKGHLLALKHRFSRSASVVALVNEHIWRLNQD